MSVDPCRVVWVGVASLTGVCRACSGTIKPGDRIAYTADNRYLHFGCQP